MFHKALVGVDGHDGGLDAAVLGRQLVAPDGELVLAHIGAGYPVAAKGDTGGYERILRVESQAVLEQASEQTGIRSHVSHVSTSVGRGLRELAERESADLVVVGATRRGPAARVFIGDDTRETLKAVRGRVAVAVAPAGYAHQSSGIGKIGLAYDGSPESRAAATVARELAIAMDAELAAIEVLDLPMLLLYSGKPREGMSTQDPLQAASSEIVTLGGFEPRVRVGYADEQLTNASDRLDLLVMGHGSAGRVRRLLRSSTSQDLARAARCALLVLSEAACESHNGNSPTAQPVSIGS
jgi:nucleotide-binding universal stress UspA family protein